MNKVFVYGTLRNSKEATHYLDDYVLYNAGPYPYIVPTTDLNVFSVAGNVIEVSDKDLEKLDRYENLQSGLYTREKVTVVNIDDMTTEEVFAYVAGDQFPRLVESGDWFSRE